MSNFQNGKNDFHFCFHRTYGQWVRCPSLQWIFGSSPSQPHHGDMLTKFRMALFGNINHEWKISDNVQRPTSQYRCRWTWQIFRSYKCKHSLVGPISKAQITIFTYQFEDGRVNDSYCKTFESDFPWIIYRFPFTNVSFDQTIPQSTQHMYTLLGIYQLYGIISTAGGKELIATRGDVNNKVISIEYRFNLTKDKRRLTFGSEEGLESICVHSDVILSQTFPGTQFHRSSLTFFFLVIQW